MKSFDEWYFENYGVNTNDLTDDEYEMLWTDAELMHEYNNYLRKAAQ